MPVAIYTWILKKHENYRDYRKLTFKINDNSLFGNKTYLHGFSFV